METPADQPQLNGRRHAREPADSAEEKRLAQWRAEVARGNADAAARGHTPVFENPVSPPVDTKDTADDDAQIPA